MSAAWAPFVACTALSNRAAGSGSQTLPELPPTHAVTSEVAECGIAVRSKLRATLRQVDACGIGDHCLHSNIAAARFNPPGQLGAAEIATMVDSRKIGVLMVGAGEYTAG